MRRIAYTLSLLFIFLVPWEDMISTSNWGSLARVAGFVLAASWLATILLEGRFRKPHLFHFLVLLFFLWNFVSVFWSFDATGTRQRITTYSQMFLVMLVLWEILQKPDQLKAGIQAYVLGGYVLTASTFYNYIRGIVAVYWEGRYSATNVNAVDMALILCIGLPMALHLFLAGGPGRPKWFWKLVNIAYIPSAAFAVILTGSRTSLLAVLPFFGYIALTPEIKQQGKLITLAGCLFLLVVLLPFIPGSLISRLSTIGSSIAGQDIGGRVFLWRESIGLLAEHPLVGIGGGALEPVIGTLAHNTYISVAAETGFVGLTLFIFILATAIFQALQAPSKVAYAWMAVFLTWAIGVLSLSWEFRKLTWLVVAFMVVAGGLERQTETEEAVLPSMGAEAPSADLSPEPETA